MRSWTLRSGVGLGVLLVITRLMWLSVPLPGPYDQGENGLWLGVEWIRQSPSEAKIEGLVSQLRVHQIRYLFVYTTWITQDGNLRHQITEDAAAFVRRMELAYPEGVLLAWIGIPTTTLQRGRVDLEDRMTRERILALCSRLIQKEGFDGIHLDVEPVPNGSAAFLGLLTEVQEAIGPQALLSIAGEDWLPEPFGLRLPYLSQIKWGGRYYQEVARRVDQIAVMTYDSGMPLASLYEIWMWVQVQQITRAVDSARVHLLFGVPAYSEVTWVHYPWAEHPESGIRGLRQGIGRLPDSSQQWVRGIALYPEWEMDKGKWDVYRRLWLGK